MVEQAWTEQTAFNAVWEHFIVNRGKPSADLQHGTCRYRMSKLADDPQRCAIGVLIPDEDYSPSLENESLGIVRERVSVLQRLDYAFCDNLQRAHDAAATNVDPVTQGAEESDALKHSHANSFRMRMRSYLRQMAHAFKLTIPGEK